MYHITEAELALFLLYTLITIFAFLRRSISLAISPIAFLFMASSSEILQVTSNVLWRRFM